MRRIGRDGTPSFVRKVLRRREGASHIGKSLSQDPGVVLVGEGVEPGAVQDCPKERRSRQGRKGSLWWKSRRCRQRGVEVQGLACSNRWSQRQLLVPPGLLPLCGAHCVVLAYLGGCWVSISGWSTFRGTSPRSCLLDLPGGCVIGISRLVWSLDMGSAAMSVMYSQKLKK